MRILVVGAGSVGGYLGGKLAAAGRDVTFLVRAARAAQLQRDGLRVVGASGDLTLTPKTISAAEITGPYDLVLLAVKSYGLDAAIEDFAPAVGSETMILPFLNGMRHIDVLSARFGAKAVLGGVTRISTDLDSDGRILQLSEFNDLVYGEFDCAVTPRIQALQKTLSNAGIDDELSPDIVKFMWEKWVMLASSAVITCLLRGNIGEVAAVPHGPETATAIIDECAAIGAAEGYPMSEKAMAFTYERLRRPGSTFTASMYRNLQKGQPVEVDQILVDLLERGKSHRVDAPLLQAACVELKVYEARRTED
jgi:2-dehydropantoate 2-reductase